MRKLGNRTSKLLGVKMDPEALENLLIESATRKITVSELVRELINDHQSKEAKMADTRDELEQLRGDINKLRHEFARATEAILTHAGKVPKEKAIRWVRKTFGTGSD